MNTNNIVIILGRGGWWPGILGNGKILPLEVEPPQIGSGGLVSATGNRNQEYLLLLERRCKSDS